MNFSEITFIILVIELYAIIIGLQVIIKILKSNQSEADAIANKGEKGRTT